MNERDHEDFIPCKKFKWRHEKNEEISRGGHKGDAEVGSYFLGPVIKKYGRTPLTQCLARKKGTDDYYLMKILVLDDLDTSDKCSFIRRTVFHNEYSILSMLKNHHGVIKLQDFFKEYSQDENGGKQSKRVCMVLECLIPHGHHNRELIPLSHFLKEGRLNETEALYIFYNILLVIEDIHNKNIVHRDLKLANIILNRRTLKVKLVEFSYAKFLTSETEVHYSHCSDVADGGQPVLSKTCDMLSAGLILHAILNACMPFPGAANHGSPVSSSRSLRDLYSRIMKSDFMLDGTKNMLRDILWKIPQFRLKASEAVDMVSTLLALQSYSQNPSLYTESKTSDQVVPEWPDSENSKHQQERPDTKPSRVLPPTDSEPETESRQQRKRHKTSHTTEEETLPQVEKLSANSRDNDTLLDRKEIKYAMLRLGVTSINNINALSFSYSKKNAR